MRTEPPAISILVPVGASDMEKYSPRFSVAQTGGRRNVGLNLESQPTFFITKLQRGQAISVESNVGVDGIGVQALADHEYTFSMFVSALSDERNVRGQRNVSGSFCPNEMKCVRGEPHVLAAAGDDRTCLRSAVSYPGENQLQMYPIAQHSLILIGCSLP